MFIDSHCHLDLLDLTPYKNDFSVFMQAEKQHQIHKMLCISLDLETYPAMLARVEAYSDIYVSVGVHPNVKPKTPLSSDELLVFAKNTRVIAIGETGLDYFRSSGDLSWQVDNLKTHIQVAKTVNKPLIIHSREAKHDVLDILKTEGASEVGGVIHCFTEDWAFAEKALALNFYISFSGIVSFKNARSIQEVAAKIPADKFLIETDSPYLAPVPFRGKPNYPHHVRHVAEKLAELRGVDVETIAKQSTENFQTLFSV
jgi:TatD DNase family protein